MVQLKEVANFFRDMEFVFIYDGSYFQIARLKIWILIVIQKKKGCMVIIHSSRIFRKPLFGSSKDHQVEDEAFHLSASDPLSHSQHTE